jgi:hypothetical protein
LKEIAIVHTTPLRQALIVLALSAAGSVWFFSGAPQKQSDWQSVNQTRKNLSIAIYRYWANAIPYCEQYFQFTEYPFSSADMTHFSSGEKWKRLHFSAANRNPANQACRHQGRTISL